MNKNFTKIVKTITQLVALFLLLWNASAQALVLEDLIANGTLETTLQNKKIGYYLGSFDPLHKGHEVVAKLPIKQKLCDFVLIYPAWGGDSYKTRADVSLRLDMLYAVFATHPKIIVTRLPPKKLQTTLTVPANLSPSVIIKEQPQIIVKPAFVGTSFIGIIGSDTALGLAPNEDAAATFMTGIQIAKKYQTHTLGGCMALPVKTFIVAIRAGDDLSLLYGKVRNRKIIAIIDGDSAQK